MADNIAFPTTTHYDSGYAHTLPIPHHEAIEGMYYPECDTLYLRSEHASEQEPKFESLTTLDSAQIGAITNGETTAVQELDAATLIEHFHEGVHDQRVANHELGHALLTKTSYTRSPVVAQNVTGNFQLSTVLSRTNWSAELLEKFAVNQLARARKQALDKNLTRPVHESFARIVEAHRSSDPTYEHLISQLRTIDDNLSEWTLSHPGYDDFARTSSEDQTAWETFLWSYKRSILSGAVDVYIALDEELAYELLVTAASTAIHMYVTDPDSITESKLHGIPSISFANAVVNLWTNRNELFTLKENGVSNDIIAQIYRESVGFGSIGLNSIEATLREGARKQFGTETVVTMLKQTQERLNATTLPSLLLIEQSDSHTITPVYNPSGLPLWMIFLTLLRFTLIDSIRRNEDRFDTAAYESLLETVAENVPQIPMGVGQEPLNRTQELFAAVSEAIPCSDIQSKAAKVHRDQLQQSNLDQIAGELAVPENSTFVDLAAQNSLEQRLQILNEAPANDARPMLESMETITRQVTHSWNVTTIETFLGSLTASLAGYTGIEPSTPRLTRYRGLIQQIAVANDDSERVLGGVYGNAIGEVLADVQPANPTDWIERLNQDFLQSQAVDDFDESCFKSYCENMLWKYIHSQERKKPGETTHPERFEAPVSLLIETVFAAAIEANIEFIEIGDALCNISGCLDQTYDDSGVGWVKTLLIGCVQKGDKFEPIVSVTPIVEYIVSAVITQRSPPQCASIFQTVEALSERYPELLDIESFYRMVGENLHRIDATTPESEWIPFLMARYAAICD